MILKDLKYINKLDIFYLLFLAPMVAKEFLVTIGGNDDFIVKIDPPPNETLSGQPSFYNGLILNYSVVGSDQQQQVIGV